MQRVHPSRSFPQTHFSLTVSLLTTTSRFSFSLSAFFFLLLCFCVRVRIFSRLFNCNNIWKAADYAGIENVLQGQRSILLDTCSCGLHISWMAPLLTVNCSACWVMVHRKKHVLAFVVCIDVMCACVCGCVGGWLFGVQDHDKMALSWGCGIQMSSDCFNSGISALLTSFFPARTATLTQ